MKERRQVGGLPNALHCVTLVRLFAPVMPFLTEVMYQNLEQSRSEEAAALLSIHHCRFPEVDEPLIDLELSADMEALLRLVSLGSSLRIACGSKCASRWPKSLSSRPMIRSAMPFNALLNKFQRN